MDLEHFRVNVADGIAAVTFDRPPVNAQGRRTREELLWIFDTASERDDIRCLILTGARNIFSAGADIRERVGMSQQPGDYRRHNRLTRESFFAIADCAKPVIAAVNGAALGAGVGLMLHADILLASENAYIAMPEIDVGLAGGARFLAEHFSHSTARRLIFTGDRMTAAELHRLGLIETVTSRDDLMPAAMAIAKVIAAKSPLAMKKAKMAFDTVAEMPYREAYRFEQGITVELSHTEDAAEAQRAFLEKRSPVFKGR